MIKIPRIILAGDRSSAGKTTISVGIMALLREKGRVVQPYKVGLDYIDPSYHSLITGRQGENLDGYLMPDRAVTEAFVHSSEGADIAVIEGVRGLYEGLESLSDVGSTAQIAKILKSPVILIVDAQSITRSTAAIVKGYKDFDRNVNLRGVILNNQLSQRTTRQQGQSDGDLRDAGFVQGVLDQFPDQPALALLFGLLAQPGPVHVEPLLAHVVPLFRHAPRRGLKLVLPGHRGWMGGTLSGQASSKPGLGWKLK